MSTWAPLRAAISSLLPLPLALGLLALGGAAAAAASAPGSAGPIAYQRLSFVDGQRQGGLFARGAARRDAQRSLGASADAEAPAYSPDGRLIAFAADPDEVRATRPRIYVMKADGSAVRPLTAGAQRDGHPSFSPDGRSVVFDRTTTGVDHYAHVFVVGLDGGGLRQLTHGPEARDTDPTFAPSGKTIAFVSERADDGTGDRFDIFSMRANGTRLKVLIDGPLKDEEPDYSPDGRSIAFTSNRRDGPNVFLARADGRQARPLTRAHGGCYRGRCFLSPSWAPDGRHIALVAQAGESSDLATIRADGGGLRVIASGSEGAGAASGPIFGPAWGSASR